MSEETKPKTVEHGVRSEIVTGMIITGKIIRANGEVEDLGVLGEWRPPLSFRIGMAIRRFLADVETALEADGFVLSFGMKTPPRLIWRIVVHVSVASARALWRQLFPRRK